MADTRRLWGVAPTPCQRISLGSSFSKLSLQRTPVNSQSASGLRNVLIAVGENTVNMLPFRLSEGRNRNLFVGFGRFDFCTATLECTQYVIGIGWLREKVNSSKPNSVDRGSDASETGNWSKAKLPAWVTGQTSAADRQRPAVAELDVDKPSKPVRDEPQPERKLN